MQRADRASPGDLLHTSATALDTACDSGADAPHPWGETLDADDRPWHVDPWQGLDTDYRRWQQARYRQLADEFIRAA